MTDIVCVARSLRSVIAQGEGGCKSITHITHLIIALVSKCMYATLSVFI